MNNLDYDGASIFVDELFEGKLIAARSKVYARQQRFERLAILRLPRNGQRAESASVERMIEGHDLKLVWRDFPAVCPSHLQRGFHRFCSGVAEEGPLESARFR